MMPNRFNLAVWNARNRRAREEYYAHPVAHDHPNRYYAGCGHCKAARKTA